MEVKPGYKQTEIGVIPEDWEVKPLAYLVTEFRGGAALRPRDFTRTGIKVLPKGGVGRTGWLRVTEDDFQFCSERYAAAHRNNQVDQSFTIVVLRDLVPSGPSIGLMVQIKEAETYVLAQGVYGFKLNEQAAPRYLIQLSNTRWYRQLMNSIMVGSTQVHITNTAFKCANLPVPPLPEQRAIAGALSDMDALLTALDRLIAKKRDIKQAAMQQLLTGQTRLPGFSGEWEVKRLGEIFEVSAGKSKSTFVIPDGDYWVVDMGSVSTGGQLVVSKLTNFFGDFLNVGDLIMPKDDIGGGNIIGKVAYIDADKRYVLGDHVYCLRAKKGDPRFLAYTINSHPINRALRKKVIGSAQLGLGRRSVTEQEIPFPDPAEQRAIAEVLSDMDGELAALEERREKTRLLKQGMMQELLTGRVRLV
jgi:type I restriction enzyme, S subunit